MSGMQVPLDPPVRRLDLAALRALAVRVLDETGCEDATAAADMEALRAGIRALIPAVEGAAFRRPGGTSTAAERTAISNGRVWLQTAATLGNLPYVARAVNTLCAQLPDDTAHLVLADTVEEPQTEAPPTDPTATAPPTVIEQGVLYANIDDSRDPAGAMRALEARAAKLGLEIALAHYDVGPHSRPCAERVAWPRIARRIEQGGITALLVPQACELHGVQEWLEEQQVRVHCLRGAPKAKGGRP